MQAENSGVKKTFIIIAAVLIVAAAVIVEFVWEPVHFRSVQKNAVTISDSGVFRVVRLEHPTSTYNLRVAVWSDVEGQDDLTWDLFEKKGDNIYEAVINLKNLMHGGECTTRCYSDNSFLCEEAFTISEKEHFLAKWLYGNDSNIDFVQCAVNIAKDNSIGYGHDFPNTISCAGLIGLALTYCGYGDFITGYGEAKLGQEISEGWGYIDLGPEYERRLTEEVGCERISGFFSSSNTELLLPGDLLYFYRDEDDNHIGIYLGNGYTVEARGPEGTSDIDVSGKEVAVCNWARDPVVYDTVFRIPQDKLHFRWK